MSSAFLATPAPSYVAGDTPATPLELTVTDAPATTSGASATWELEAGDTEPATIDGVTYESGVVTLTLPAGAVATEGVVAVLVTLTTTAGGVERLEPLRVAVEPASSFFLTLAELRSRWADAPEDNAELYDLSSTSITQILRWAPDDPDDPERPTRSQYRKAQLQQCRASWNASAGTISEQVGDGEYATPVYPLDWHVKNTLRSRDAAGGVV